jgi:tRNA pseudouridine55 synthase
LETTVSEPKDISLITPDMIYAATLPFIGTISQLPPQHSAIRIQGKRAYEFAREGKDIALKPRAVEIKAFEITAIALPDVHFRIVCSKGTYIRSIARDFGEALQVGAYMAELCRTRIGNFNLESAMQLDEITKEG